MTPHHLNRLNLLPDKYLMLNEPSTFTKSIKRAIHSHKLQRIKDFHNINEENQKFNNEYVTINGKAYPKLSILNKIQAESDQSKSKLMNEINDYDLALLLNMALAKIPAIPFQYLMDVFRWNLFNGTVSMKDANALYWNLAIKEQGIHPPDNKDRRHYFDLGAKFHTSDNTPYTR